MNHPGLFSKYESQHGGKKWYLNFKANSTVWNYCFKNSFSAFLMLDRIKEKHTKTSHY